jgi:hypothetical protein
MFISSKTRRLHRFWPHQDAYLKVLGALYKETMRLGCDIDYWPPTCDYPKFNVLVHKSNLLLHWKHLRAPEFMVNTESAITWRPLFIIEYEEYKVTAILQAVLQRVSYRFWVLYDTVVFREGKKFRIQTLWFEIYHLARWKYNIRRNIIFIIIMYLSWSWATCWPVPVSRIQKYLQRSIMILSPRWGVVFHYPG